VPSSWSDQARRLLLVLDALPPPDVRPTLGVSRWVTAGRMFEWPACAALDVMHRAKEAALRSMSPQAGYHAALFVCHHVFPQKAHGMHLHGVTHRANRVIVVARPAVLSVHWSCIGSGIVERSGTVALTELPLVHVKTATTGSQARRGKRPWLRTSDAWKRAIAHPALRSIGLLVTSACDRASHTGPTTVRRMCHKNGPARCRSPRAGLPRRLLAAPPSSRQSLRTRSARIH
jgi:hypothetical protein